MRRSPFQLPSGDYAANTWYLLRDRITNLLQEVATNAGSTTQNTQQVETLLSDIKSTLIDVATTVEFSNWDELPGNSVEFEYYAGIEAGNPSGSTNNVKYIRYKKGVSTSLTKEFTYNSTDKVLTITTT